MLNTIHGTISVPFSVVMRDANIDGISVESLCEQLDVHPSYFLNYALSDEAQNITVWDTQPTVNIESVESGDADLGFIEVEL